MNPEQLGTIKKATVGLEHSLDVFETYLESDNNRPLYLATLCLVDALKNLHAVDPGLLGAGNLSRIEAILVKEGDRNRKGRDGFNTGF